MGVGLLAARKCHDHQCVAPRHLDDSCLADGDIGVAFDLEFKLELGDR